MSVQNSQLIRMLQARERYEKAYREKVNAEEAKKLAEAEVHAAMEDAKDKSITRDLGPPWGVKSFTVGQTEYSDVYNEDALLSWAKAEHREQEFFGEVQPRKKPLNQYIRRVLRTRGMKMPPGVEMRRKIRVTVKDK